MKIIAIEHETPGATAEQFAPLLEEEARQVWALQQDGVIRAAHFRVERSEAVLELECAGVEAAREALESLPLVRAGLIRFELIGLRPYPGFARLFKETV